MQQTTPRILLVDGHSLAYRAFYAMPPLSTKDGQPVNAVLGFTNMLLKSIENEKPTHVVMSFDRGLPTERLKEFADYKAGRDHMPEDLQPQIQLIEDVVSAFGIPIFAEPGHEADDCLGTLARRAEEAGFEVVLISGDLDMLQLVSPHIRVMATIRGISDTVRYDEKAVFDRFGFSPSRIADFKALAGDTSDAIPGVQGIGKGTASKLIVDFGSIDDLLHRLAEVPARWRDKIAAQREDVLKYRKLATIETALPLDIDWEQCRWTQVPADARALLERLEFKQIIMRMERNSLLAAPTADGGAAAPVQADEFHVVDSLAALQLMAGALGSASHVGLAWVRENGSTVALAAASGGSRAHVAVMCMPVAEGFLPGMQPQSGLQLDEVMEALQPSLRGKPIWTFDLKSALVACERWLPATLDLRDVAIASYLLESDESQKSLQAIAVRHGSRVPAELDEVLGKRARSWAEVEPHRVAAYAGSHACAIWQLAEVLPQRLQQQEQVLLFEQLELPMARILARMERYGVAVDVPYLQQLSAEMDRDLEKIRRDIVGMAGTDFNLNSPKQLGEVLFDKLQIAGGKRTKSGAYTTDVEVLSALAAEHPICQRILDYREVAKLMSTYVEALPRLADENGRVHSSWNATVAATGRLSSSEPNLQNIPIRSEMGRRIRRAFTAGGGGWVLLAADYSQIELRIMAHLAKDERLLQIFAEGGDIHTATAAEIFGVGREAVTADMRRKAKEVNFGILYGMGPDGLASRIAVGRKEAKEYIERYHQNFSGVKKFMDETRLRAEETGWVQTILGRRRYLPDIRSRNRMMKAAAERMATNAPIQGSAADLIKQAMVRLHQQIQDGLPARMTMQVHDELVFEVEEGHLQNAADRIRSTMETALDLQVPIVVDVKAGRNWEQMQPVRLPHAVTFK